ncbi:MAG: sulfotransferase domain-containing protein [Flavobacteriales bacterium]|nr:sulfotransferase domain-containing protein [Flavobacteriales bacterium]
MQRTDWKTRIFMAVDRAHGRFNNRIKDRWPLLSVWLYHKPRSRFLHYRVERALIAGKPLNVGQRQSIVLFTVAKAASMHVQKMVGTLTKAHGMIPADFNAYFSTSSGRMYDHFRNPASLQRMFRPKGFFYGALRTHCDIPQPERFRVVVVLRDPRDVLTSQYYSQAFSHAIINERIAKQRKKVLAQTIDEAVMEEAPKLLAIYNDYLREYSGKPWALITTYEQMVADHASWLRSIAGHCGLDKHPDLVTELASQGTAIKGSGDKNQHVRVAKSGDHKNKLKPETVAELDRMFGPMLANAPWGTGVASREF